MNNTPKISIMTANFLGRERDYKDVRGFGESTYAEINNRLYKEIAVMGFKGIDLLKYFSTVAIAIGIAVQTAAQIEPAEKSIKEIPVQKVETITLEITEAPGSVSVSTGPMNFSLDLTSGTLNSLSVKGKQLVADGAEPFLFATLMESRDYDGVSDYVDHALIPAVNYCEGMQYSRVNDTFVATATGRLSFSKTDDDADAIDYTLELKTVAGSTHLEIAVSLVKQGYFKNRFIREIGLRQPLGLNVRKRVVQAADQGLRFDTRHRVHYHMHVAPFTQPDHNIWRRFYIDQNSGHSYRMWRSEDKDTAGLHVFDGRQAAGWMSMYDEDGGVLYAYRGISERAPKMLYADAEEGGEAVLYFYSPTQPAFSLNDERLCAAVFGEPHILDFIYFQGVEEETEPDARLAHIWGVEELPSDGPTRFRPVTDEVELWTAPFSAGNDSVLVMGGIPVPGGTVTTATQARLFVGSREAPCQIEPLAYWPDGSLKWLLLIFPLDGDGGYQFEPGQGIGEEVAFRVTLRQGEDVPCRLSFGRDVRTGRIVSPLTADSDDTGATFDTGPLQARLTHGSRWAASFVLNGREMLKPGNEPQAFVDFLRPASYDEGRSHASGEDDPGPVFIDKIELESAGPLRSVVRLEGMARCREPARVIMRLEFYNQRSFVRLLHSVEFMQQDTREVFVRSMGIRLPLDIDTTAASYTAGGQDGPVSIPAGEKVGLRQTRHLNYEAWHLQNKVREIADSRHLTRGWLDVSDSRGGLAVIERSMWQEGPKELLFDAASGTFEVGLWPASAPLMDVRRYSNYPHQAQGESASVDQRWVVDYYYANEPFVGVSKTHEMMLFFHSVEQNAATIDSVAADFQDQALVYAGWPWYSKVGITYPQVDPADPAFKRFNANLENVVSWYLYHQKAWGWYGMWDYGDTHHAFRTGYGRVFMPETLKKLLEMPPEEMAATPLEGLSRAQEYFTQGDWAYDNGRWGWSSTEGLVNHFMQQQYLRTGRRDTFFFVEANARHVRDVDARHAGKWFGRGTRHGVQHWSDGNHEERQTTFTEQRFHYLLTGEHRTREWNKTLADKHYLATTCKVHASHSGRAYGIFFRWEITGDPELGDIMQRYMHIFAQPEGLDISPEVKFPEAIRLGEARAINGLSMFFHTFGAMHAILEYYNVTGDERVKQSLLKMAEATLKETAESRKTPYTLRKVFAFGARYADDKVPYREALTRYFSDAGARFAFQQVPANPQHWTGPTAFFVSGISGGLFWLGDAAYSMGALAKEPEPLPGWEKKIRELETRDPLPEPRSRGGWQSEYDIPEFEEYFRDRLQP